MRSLKPRHVLATLLAVLTPGCTEPWSTDPVRPPEAPAPQLGVANAPSSLPNVFRFEGTVGGAVVTDPRTDLVVIDGLPEDVADLEVCGGDDEIFNLADVQVSGDLTGVFHLLAQAELNIHVYRLSTFVDICTSDPLARGKGRLIIEDNDAGVSGSRTNSFGHRLEGPVTLADGGKAQLAAHLRFLIKTDGTFVPVSGGVVLSR
jgi:hypothetical protein